MVDAVVRPALITTTDDAVRTGLHDILTIVISVLPFALTIGAAVVTSPIHDVAGWLGGPVIAAGSAHVTVVTLAGTATSAVAVIVTALIINARLAAYSAVLAPTFAFQPRWFRWVGPYVLVDQTFALALQHRQADAGWFRRYYLTATSTLLAAWVVGISVGMAAGPVIPGSWQLWFAVPLLFSGMVAPSVKDRPSSVAALVGGGTAMAFAGLPWGLGLVTAIVAGAIAGAMTPGGSHE